jgi:exopolysaccharide biosynthesis polyprenyl glycosylphosphotransferase
MKLYRKKYKLIETYGTFFVDLITIAIAYFVARLLRIILPFGAQVTEETEWFPVYVLCILGCILYNLMMNRYEGFFQRGYFVEASEVLKYNFVQFAFLSTCVYLFRLELVFSRLMLGYFVICDIILCYVLRVLFKAFIKATYSKGKGSEKILIVTDSKLLSKVMKNIQNDKGWSYEIVGAALTDGKTVADAEKLLGQAINRNEDIEKEIDDKNLLKGKNKKEFTPQIVAGREDLIEAARQMPIDVVFFYCGQTEAEMDQWVQSFVLMGVRCYYCVQGMSFSVPCSGVGEFADFPVMCYNNEDRDWRMSIVKRVTDIVGSIVGLLITIILLPWIAIAIKIEDSKGPVFFSQTRIGKNGRRFRIYKFRSMYTDAEKRKQELMDQNEVQGPMFKMENDPRITKVGRFLRRTSLDELPQFWNIFKGDMSLVGTRPPTEDEFEQYNDYYRRRMSITPGLTGLWQVSGRSEVTDFNEVVKLDLQYIDNWSLGQDLKILIQTVGVVITGTGSK